MSWCTALDGVYHKSCTYQPTLKSSFVLGMPGARDATAVLRYSLHFVLVVSCEVVCHFHRSVVFSFSKNEFTRGVEVTVADS